MVRHFLSETDFTVAELPALFESARQLKATRHSPSSRPLAGQSWGLLFSKSSTRTRVSFEVGLRELGAEVVYLEQKSLQIDRGESLADTARVLSRYLHGLVIRCHGHEVVEAFAAHGSIPVINGLTDWLHPCQIYSDAFTLSERWGQTGRLFESLRGRRLAYFGDCASNTAHSWIVGAALFGMELVLTGPEQFAPSTAIGDFLHRHHLPQRYIFTTDPLAAARGADVLYTDVWVSMGQEAESKIRLTQMAPYQVTTALLEAAKPDACFLHCLPAHPGEEVTTEVLYHPRSIIFDQAENRLHMQKAILQALAGKGA